MKAARSESSGLDSAGNAIRWDRVIIQTQGQDPHKEALNKHTEITIPEC